MEPTKTNFKSPTLDFFLLIENLENHSLSSIIKSCLIGIELRKDGLYVVSRDYSTKGIYCNKISPELTPLTLIYEKKIGGLSFKFDKKVFYAGNSGGNVKLSIPTLNDSYIFSYGVVARIRDKEKVIWRNSFLTDVLKLRIK